MEVNSDDDFIWQGKRWRRRRQGWTQTTVVDLASYFNHE
jgi:hypothetical protein